MGTQLSCVPTSGGLTRPSFAFVLHDARVVGRSRCAARSAHRRSGGSPSGRASARRRAARSRARRRAARSLRDVGARSTGRLRGGATRAPLRRALVVPGGRVVRRAVGRAAATRAGRRIEQVLAWISTACPKKARQHHDGARSRAHLHTWHRDELSNAFVKRQHTLSTMSQYSSMKSWKVSSRAKKDPQRTCSFVGALVGCRKGCASSCTKRAVC